MLYIDLEPERFITVYGKAKHLLAIRAGYHSGMFDRKRSGNEFRIELPLTPLSLRLVADVGVKTTVSDRLSKWYVKECRRREKLAKAYNDATLCNDEELYDFQKKGVSFLVQSRLSLLGDDPRLGKTVQSLKAMELAKPTKPVLVLTMKSLVDYWLDAVYQWTSFNAVDASRVAANKRTEILEAAKAGDIVVTNWETLLISKGFTSYKYLIADECHKARNRKAQVSRRFNMLRPDFAIVMSATMVEKGAQDYFSLVRVLRPKECQSYWRWVAWFCRTEFNGFGHSIVDNANEDLLNDYLGGLALRRLATEVADVPPKQYVTLKVQPSEQLMNLYRQIEKETILELESGRVITIPNKLAELVRLTQVSIAPDVIFGERFPSPKIEAIKDYIADLPSSTQVIVYCSFRSVADTLVKTIPNAQRFIGGDGFPQDFVEGRTQVLVSTPSVGGVGIDFSCADVIIYADLPNSATILKQSQERTTKIGLKKPRLIVTVVCTPIDYGQAAALKEKQERITNVDIYNHILTYLNYGFK